MFCRGRQNWSSPGASRSFALAAPAGVVTARCFDEYYHEIFNELPAQTRPGVCRAQTLAGRTVLTRAPVWRGLRILPSRPPSMPIRSPALPRPTLGCLALRLSAGR